MVTEQKPKARAWRPDEIAYLKQHYYQSDAKTIAKKLGRTLNSVESKVADLRRKNQFSHAAKLADAPKQATAVYNTPKTLQETIDEIGPQKHPKSLWEKIKDFFKG